MRIALVDSGLGLLATAAALRRARPDLDLVLSMDPEGVPWGPRSAAEVTARTLACARAASAHGPDALVLACNTASVLALEAVRDDLEPRIPVIGTVPPVRPAARAAGRLAIWSTPATSGSAYQRRLVGRFAAGCVVSTVACYGLATAIERGGADRVRRALTWAVARTPPDVGALVLGCTHYELIADGLPALVGSGVRVFTAGEAVAAEALRRAGPPPPTDGSRRGGLTVLAGGRAADLPDVALRYPAGRLLRGR